MLLLLLLVVVVVFIEAAGRPRAGRRLGRRLPGPREGADHLQRGSQQPLGPRGLSRGLAPPERDDHARAAGPHHRGEHTMM